MKNTFFIAVLFLFLWACKKEKELDQASEWLDAYSQTTFECTGDSSSLYFRGIFNKEPFCYNDGIDGYSALSYTVSSHTTTKPVFNISSSTTSSENSFNFSIEPVYPPALYQEHFAIELPYTDDTSRTWRDIIETVTQVGEYPIRDDTMHTFKGINIQLWIPYKSLGVNGFKLTAAYSSGGPQTGSHFIVEEVEQSFDLLGKVQYILKGRLNCKLYWPKGSALDGEYLGRLHDCTFSFLVSEP